jgi:branched-chain amino acid transport system ATP-binding protein
MTNLATKVRATGGIPASVPDPTGELLSIDGVTVRFGGVVANNRVSMTCREGEVTALLGPNGAGKSTLFDVITGARQPLEGRVVFRGRDITRLQPYQRARLGIARSFQNLALSRELTVFENVLLGAAPFRNYGLVAAMLALPKVRKNDRLLSEIAERAIDVVGLTQVAHRRAGDLPFGDLHRVEMARALALSPALLMLDEPSAGLDRHESMELAAALRRVQREWGVAILVVEHDLEFVQEVGDHAAVLDFGEVIATGTVRAVLNDPAVHTAYLGTDHA